MSKFRGFGVAGKAALMSLAVIALFAVQSPGRGERVVAAHLSAPEGIESRGQGQAVFKLSSDGLSMQYRLNVANIEDVTMAHIHLRPNATALNGPPVVWLYPSVPPAVLIEGRSDGTLAAGVFTDANFVATLAGMTMNDLLEKIEEGLTYVNVHTLAHPGGEIRGEIR